MLDSLRFVQGAVARKDIVAAFTHFRINNGMIKAHNGGLTLCAPIALDIDVMPKATTFTKALQTCTGPIVLAMTASGRLSVKSGKFKAYIDCVGEGFPPSEPEGTVIQMPQGGMTKALKRLMPFIAEDASRPWARGILFRDKSAYATNNVVLIEYWLGYSFPHSVNIPKQAVAEMVRIGEDPTHMQVSDTSVTFFFSGGRWLKTDLYALEWPDLNRVLGVQSNPIPQPEELWQALENIAPFTDKLRRVYIKDGVVSTDPTDTPTASEEVEGGPTTGIYNLDYLLGIKDIVAKMDFTRYPKPATFFSDRVRGVIIGMSV